MAKLLHLFLRARRDSQSYDNDWHDDFRLRSIKTYDQVALHCREAMLSGASVRVHRRRFGTIPAMICGECSVKSVVPEQGGFRVTFDNWRSLSIPSDRRMQKGFYFADPAEYEDDESE